MFFTKPKTKLPVGITEFHEWADRIIAKAGQFADSDSMKFALASQLIHLAHDVAEKEEQFFVNCLRKAAANQVASQVFQDIKTKQLEAQKAAQSTAAEVPAQPAGTSNAQTPS